MSRGLALAAIEYRSTHSLARVFRMNEERANLRRSRRRIQIRCVSCRKLVATEKRPPSTPTTATDQLARAVGNEVSAVVDQIRVNAKHRRNGGFDLCVVVMFAAQSARRLRDQPLNVATIGETCLADNVIHDRT